jgi:hypothetical protein
MESAPRDELTPLLLKTRRSSDNLTVALEAMQGSFRGYVLLDYVTVHKSIIQPSHVYPLLKLVDRFPDKFVKLASTLEQIDWESVDLSSSEFIDMLDKYSNLGKFNGGSPMVFQQLEEKIKEVAAGIED